ncbi:hypothetical protein PVAP13_3KG063800 [Panicum virgatum]|uniref:DUF4220 domain-containing protein n=1 Tax=Panicum virgatum TaxID=38727 RepID=A0A8T0UHJ0_PANVG|nr:hypothetical protein PVAP13_3KG063800 [Panicum virgatum]
MRSKQRWVTTGGVSGWSRWSWASSTTISMAATSSGLARTAPPTTCSRVSRRCSCTPARRSTLQWRRRTQTRSDRWMVAYMCRAHHQKDGLRRMVAHLRRSIKLPEFIRSNDYWQSRIGQYSLLEETRRRPRSMAADAATLLFRPRSWFGHKAQESESSPARLPPGLKASIVRVLRESNGELDGVPSLERAHNLPYWELRGHRSSHKIKVVLKWHIATCYCDIALRRSLEQPVGTSSRGVAEALSMYCGYLVAFRPALLPGRQSYTKAAFQQVLDEVMALVGDQLSVQGRFESLERRREQGHMETLEQTVTLSDGLDLGYLLISRVRDRELLWRVLENIWVKLILSLAPQQSDDAAYAKHHATYLARGGEFVTHLWAMLSHAGILEQSTWPRDGQVHEEPQEFYNQLMARYANVHYSPRCSTFICCHPTFPFSR